MNFSFAPTNQNQALLGNHQQREQAHLGLIKNIMESLYKLQQQQELHFLIQYLQNSQENFSKEIDQCFK